MATNTATPRDDVSVGLAQQYIESRIDGGSEVSA